MNQQGYYRISIKGIVINDDGRILLSKEENGMWEMLGGGLDHDEDPIDCLRREIKEEAGLEVVYVSPSPKYFVTSPRVGKTITTYMANIIYEIRLKDLAFVPSEECQELRFFNTEEMGEVELFPNVQKLREILMQQRA
ncbi:MAG TPA: NUDIX hydrolase [Patescibacteria group bacterium]|nr:NUDIX hydrolase [Patescibacteria group bacterium]